MKELGVEVGTPPTSGMGWAFASSGINVVTRTARVMGAAPWGS
jgi:hypothetical protein